MKLSLSQRWQALWSGQVEVPVATVSPPAPLVRTVVGSYNGFTLSLWQQSNDHIKWAQVMFQDAKFRDMLAVLSNATPVIDQKVPDAFSKELGRFLGYRELLGVLFMLPRFPEAAKPQVEADYDAEAVLDRGLRGADDAETEVTYTG